MYRPQAAVPPDAGRRKTICRLSTMSQSVVLPALALLLTVVSSYPVVYALGHRGSFLHIRLPPAYRDALVTFSIRGGDTSWALIGLLVAAVLWGGIVWLRLRPIHRLEIDLGSRTLRLARFGKTLEETPLLGSAHVSVRDEVVQRKWSNEHSASRGPVIVRRTITTHRYTVHVTGLNGWVYWTTSEGRAWGRARRIARLCAIQLIH
jgi:hypothetical protein